MKERNGTADALEVSRSTCVLSQKLFWDRLSKMHYLPSLFSKVLFFELCRILMDRRVRFFLLQISCKMKGKSFNFINGGNDSTLIVNALLDLIEISLKKFLEKNLGFWQDFNCRWIFKKFLYGKIQRSTLGEEAFLILNGWNFRIRKPSFTC